jgi:hypothetical protein
MEPRNTSRAASAGGSSASSGDTQASGEQAQRSAGLVDKIKERATSQLTTQKERATEGIGSLAQAVRQSTDRLRNEQHDTVAQYVERAAQQLERWSNDLREKDVTELLQGTQRLARRQPALFIGSSFAAGLLLARFLKSSRENDTSEYSRAASYTASGMPRSDQPGA